MHDGEDTMVYKLLVTNIDGTLLQDNGRMNKVTREAIEFAQNKDITVLLTTSKHYSAAKRIAKALNIEGHIIAHQGAFIGKEVNKPVYVRRITPQITKEIVALLETVPCHFKLVHEEYTIANKVKLPDSLLARVVFQRTSRFSYSEQFVDDVSEKLQETSVSPPNIEVTFENKTYLEDAQKALTAMFDEVVCIPTDSHSMQIVSSDVSKLNGVQYVCSQMGIRPSEVVAIGSGMDDLSLVKWAGLGVAMGNAPQEVKAVANWLTRSNNDNGVAYMVKEHFRKQYKLEFLRKIDMLK